ncbi:MAG TPA: hypothetical protein VIK85_00485 [Coriobacteriia bacterium]
MTVTRMEAERRRLGMTKARLAREAGMNATTVMLISSGRLRPYVGQQERLERVLGIEAGHLLEEVEG